MSPIYPYNTISDKVSLKIQLDAPDQRYEGNNTTCWKNHWRSIWGWNVCVLDRRNVDTHSAASVVWCGFFRSDALGDACNHSRNRIDPWARHYANSVVLCFLSDWLFSSWGVRLDVGDWRPKRGLPDCRYDGMAIAARD